MRLEIYRPMLQPDGSIMQAQIRIGYSIVMIGELESSNRRPKVPVLGVLGNSWRDGTRLL